MPTTKTSSHIAQSSSGLQLDPTQTLNSNNNSNCFQTLFSLLEILAIKAARHEVTQSAMAATNYSSNHHRRQLEINSFLLDQQLKYSIHSNKSNSKRVKCTNHVSRENERPYLTACTSRLKSEQKTFSNPTLLLTPAADSRRHHAAKRRNWPFSSSISFERRMCGIATLLFYLLNSHSAHRNQVISHPEGDYLYILLLPGS